MQRYFQHFSKNTPVLMNYKQTYTHTNPRIKGLFLKLLQDSPTTETKILACKTFNLSCLFNGAIEIDSYEFSNKETKYKYSKEKTELQEYTVL